MCIGIPTRNRINFLDLEIATLTREMDNATFILTPIEQGQGTPI